MYHEYPRRMKQNKSKYLFRVHCGNSTQMRLLYAGYAAWCLTRQRRALPLPAFVVALDHARAENGLHTIRKRNDRYYGIRISASRRESLLRQ